MRPSILCVCVSLCIVIQQVEPTVGNSDPCSRRKFSVNPQARARLTAILGLRADDKGICAGAFSDFSIQNIALLQWAVDKFNSANYVDGVEIGLDVYDDCGLDRYSIASALEAIGDLPISSEDQCGITNNTVLHIGIIGSSRSQTTKAVLKVLAGTGTFVLSPYATSPDLTEYSDHFYRTVPSDVQQAEAIVQLMKRLGWTYVAAIHTDDNYGKRGISTIDAMAKQEGICIDETIEIEKTRNEFSDTDIKDILLSQRMRTRDGTLGVVFFGSAPVATLLLRYLNTEARSDSRLTDLYWIMSDYVGTHQGVFSELDIIGNKTFTISTYSTDVAEAREFLTQKWERVLSGNRSADQLEELMNCSFSAERKTSVPAWNPNYVLSVIDSVYVYGLALARKQRVHCSINAGVCEALADNFVPDITEFVLRYDSLEENLTVPEFSALNRTVAFMSTGDLKSDANVPLYDINQYTYRTAQDWRFTKVAEFVDSKLVVRNVSSFDDHPQSECGESCSACVESMAIPYAYIDGEALVVGMFSFHETDPSDPFKCGEFRTSSADIFSLEAFLHSIDEIRNNTGLSIGAIVFDDCYSSARAGRIMSEFMSGQVAFYKPGTNETVDVSAVVAFVGDLSSSSMISVALLLTKLNIPMISSSSSSPDLDDRINFPYFLRTVPSDEEQAMTMVKIVKHMEWEYVSALYVKNNYGSKGIDAFLRLANASNICVAEGPLAISDIDDDTTELYRHLTTLRNKQAKVVVYFGTEKRISDLLSVMQQQYSTNEKFDFLFLSSEDWGENQYIIERNVDVTKGSITLVNEASQLTDDSFLNYLRNLFPDKNARNPWFDLYWEETFSCDLQRSFTNKHKTICRPDLTFNESLIQKIARNHRVVHIIDAVKALESGLPEVKNALCRFETKFPCKNYFTYIDEVMGHIRNVTFTRGGVKQRLFRGDGNGNIGFRILNVQQKDFQTRQLQYVEVGTYDDQQLSLQTSRLVFYDRNGNPTNSLDGSCRGLCGHCSNASHDSGAIMETTTHVHPLLSEFSVSDFTIIGILGLTLIVMLILFAILICYFKKRVAALELQVKRSSTVLYRQVRDATNQNGTTYHHSAGQPSLTYPQLQFVDYSPSGGTAEEWREASYHLNKSPNGVVNKGFLSDSSAYIEAQNPLDSSDTRDHSSSSNERSRSREPNSAYKLSASNSFKRPPETPSGGQMSQIKKQPRTQLAVPPCRPDLPPREAVQRPQTLMQDFPSPDGGVHREKGRKFRNSPRKTSSMSPISYSASAMNSSSSAESAHSNNIHGMPPYMSFSSGSLQDSGQTSPSGVINVGGSMEKISRV